MDEFVKASVSLRDLFYGYDEDYLKQDGFSKSILNSPITKDGVCIGSISNVDVGNDLIEICIYKNCLTYIFTSDGIVIDI